MKFEIVDATTGKTIYWTDHAECINYDILPLMKNRYKFKIDGKQCALSNIKDAVKKSLKN